MDLGEQADRVKFMIRPGPDFTGASDAVLADAGIRTVICNVRTPRMNAIAERWIGDAAANSSTAPLSGTRATCGGSCASTRPPQPAPAPPLPAHRSTAETTTRASQSRAGPRPKTGSRRLHDQRISPGRMTRTGFSARTGSPGTQPPPAGRGRPLPRPRPARLPPWHRPGPRRDLLRPAARRYGRAALRPVRPVRDRPFPWRSHPPLPTPRGEERTTP